MADVLVIGELLAEFMAEKVGQRFDAPGIFLGPYPSGAPAIFIDQVAKIGASCAMVGCVGKDGFGDLVVNRLKSDGVDVSFVTRAENLPTGTAFVTYKADGSRDFIFNIGNSAAALIDPARIPDHAFSKCSYFHVMGSFLSTESSRGLIFDAIKRVKKNGGKITFDPNVRAELLSSPGMKEAIFEVLNQCSVFLPSEDDLKFMFQSTDEAASIKKLLQQTQIELVAVKKSKKGATFYDREKSFNVPAYKIAEVDPTGAGDSFGGAFIGCLIKKIPIERALDIACAAGALAVSKRGPMEGVFSLVEIERFMGTTERVK